MDESEKKFLYYRIGALQKENENIKQYKKDMLQNISALVQENKKLQKQLEKCKKKSSKA